MPHYRIEDSLQGYEFDGDLIAGPVDTRELPGRPFTRRPRWLEMSLYRTNAGTYVIHRVNRSLVYHDPAASCARGVKASCTELPENATPCGALPPRPGKPQCRPPAPGALNGKPVMLEQDQSSVDRCPDYAAVVGRLSEAYHRKSRVTSNVMSVPMRELLRQAALNDPAFQVAAQDKPTVEIS